MPKEDLKIEDSFMLAEKILQKITLNIVRKVENHLHGDYKSIFQGHGLDFKEIREYSINDDIKTIDWNATARTGKPHVRVYEEERDNTVWLILDVSSSMDFGSFFTTKKEVLIQIAGVMGYLSYKRGDKTGAVLFNKGIEEIIPPEKGLKQIYKIIQKLLDYKPEEKSMSDTGLRSIEDLSKLPNITGKKKSLFFISDFIFSDFLWEKSFGELAIKNDFTVIHIADPVEEKIPDAGYINIYDPETGKKLLFDTSNPEIVKKYQEFLEQENKKINKIFSILNLKPVKIYTNSDIAEVLIFYIDQQVKTRK